MRALIVTVLGVFSAACSGRLAEFPDELFAGAPSPSADGSAPSPSRGNTSVGADAAVGVQQASPRPPDESFIETNIGSFLSAGLGTRISISNRLEPDAHTRVIGSTCGSLALDSYEGAGGALYEVTNWNSRSVVLDVEPVGGAPEMLVALREFPFRVSDVVKGGNCLRVVTASSPSRAQFKHSAGTGVTLAPNESVYVYAQDANAVGTYDLTLYFTVAALP